MRRRQEGAPERSGLNRQKEAFGGEAVALSFRKGKGVPGMTIDGIVQFFDGRGSTSNPGRQGSGDQVRWYNGQKTVPARMQSPRRDRGVRCQVLWPSDRQRVAFFPESHEAHQRQSAAQEEQGRRLGRVGDENTHVV